MARAERRKFREDFVATAAKAIAHPALPGCKLTPSELLWDLSFTCKSPVGYTDWCNGREGRHAPLALTLRLRCRKCEPCLAARRAHWIMRAQQETAESIRTWFGTATLSPREQFLLETETRMRLSGRSVTYDTLNDTEKFVELSRTLLDGRMRKVWKSLRRLSTFTYLVVAEPHESGRPHLHLLVHEKDPAKPITWRTLAQAWPFGYTQFKLVKGHGPQAAHYVAKYLNKTHSGMRIRCSKHYGDGRSPVEIRSDLHSVPARVTPSDPSAGGLGAGSPPPVLQDSDPQGGLSNGLPS